MKMGSPFSISTPGEILNIETPSFLFEKFSLTDFPTGFKMRNLVSLSALL